MFSSGSDEQIRKSHLLMLMKLSAADQQSSELEQKFIEDIALKLGYNDTDLAELQNGKEEITEEIPTSEVERMTFFYHFLFLMKIDGNVTKEERELCSRLGFRLGFRPALVNELIDIMASYVKQKVPAGVMIEAIRKYLN